MSAALIHPSKRLALGLLPILRALWPPHRGNPPRAPPRLARPPPELPLWNVYPPGPVRGTAKAGAIGPAAATDDPGRSSRHNRVRRGSRGVPPVRVQTPLIYIAVHVVQAEGVGRVGSDSRG